MKYKDAKRIKVGSEIITPIGRINVEWVGLDDEWVICIAGKILGTYVAQTFKISDIYLVESIRSII